MNEPKNTKTINPEMHGLIKILAGVAVENYLIEIGQMPPREKPETKSKKSKKRKRTV